MPVAAGLAYEWHGDEGLPVAVFSSGLGGLGDYWEPNRLLLSDSYRLLVYDHRGTGGSERDGPAQTIADMADDVAALLDALGIDEPVGFVGHALGGLIGLELAMRAPNRVQRLMVVNGWARLDPHTARCFDTRLALLRDSGPATYLHAQPLFLYPPAWISAHDNALIESAADQLVHFAGAATMEARIGAARAFDPGAYRLGTLATPVMCLATEDDMLVPPQCSESLAKLIPNATFATMAHGGHAVNVTRAQDFNLRVADWLR